MTSRVILAKFQTSNGSANDWMKRVVEWKKKSLSESCRVISAFKNHMKRSLSISTMPSSDSVSMSLHSANDFSFHGKNAKQEKKNMGKWLESFEPAATNADETTDGDGIDEVNLLFVCLITISTVRKLHRTQSTVLHSFNLHVSAARLH